ncbi:hypothetical protein [Streptomyces geranii]|uniref:hypothetical protein n=1 Tax=Streptomyces geranii TaxID=2058923 RepID=UPI000D03F2DB|nr:hypothetical protein [Streptomyces geranii]
MAAAGVDYLPWEGQGLRDDECFVCTVRLSETDRTVEDVVPRWMQREIMPPRHPKPQVLLPNLSPITPRRILIPACKSCNNEHLSRVEIALSKAFQEGADAVRALPERTLRVWAAKIAYGLRRNDMRLRSNQRDPAAPMIATAADLQGMLQLHTLLQECRDVVRVTEGHSTFFVFRSQQVGCNACDFDIAVPTGWPYTVMVRLGPVTVMGAVDDRGALRTLHSTPAFAAASGLSLHPLQVRALLALLVHQAHLIREDRLPLRYGVSGRRLWLDRLPPQGPTTDPRREQATADQILQNLVAASPDVLAAHGGAVGLLVLPAGTPRHMPLKHGVLSLGAERGETSP